MTCVMQWNQVYTDSYTTLNYYDTIIIMFCVRGFLLTSLFKVDNAILVFMQCLPLLDNFADDSDRLSC